MLGQRKKGMLIEPGKLQDHGRESKRSIKLKRGNSQELCRVQSSFNHISILNVLLFGEAEGEG